MSSHPDLSSFNRLPLELARLIDATAFRAERDWSSGGQLEIEDYLREVPPGCRAELLEELLSLIQASLRHQGKESRAEEWIIRFPEYPETVQRVISECGQATALPSLQDLAARQDLPPLDRFPNIPGYTVQRLLGRGAMGVVYLARHDRLQRLVALKLVAAGIDLRQAMVLIRTEAETIARLKHPHIVQVFDVGEENGEPYLSLEFIDGESLREHLQREQIPPKVAAELVEKMSRAMHHAHMHGVIHRDLKPANVLLPRSESELKDAKAKSLTPKISDFGLAKVLDVLQEQTQAGSLLGTPRYMAPEQAEGRNREVGPPADIYALGAILFEILTGQAPFAGDSSFKLLHSISHQEVTFRKDHARQLPEEIQAICLKCLEKSPSRRYGSALELADDIRRFLDDFPVLARRSSRVDHFTKFARRHRSLTISTCLVLLTLLAGSIGTGFFAYRESTARSRAETLARNESESRRQVESLLEEQRRDVYWANVRMAHEAYKVGHLDDMRQLLEEIVPTRDSGQDLRGFEWNYLMRLSQPDARVLTTESFGGRICYSRNGKLLAVPNSDASITIWDADGWKPHLHLQGHTRGVFDLDFSPDGTKLISGATDNMTILWDLETGQQKLCLTAHQAPVRTVKFSPDGQTMLSADEKDTVFLWDTKTGQQRWRISQDELYVMDCDWSPDGRQIALGSGRGTLLIVTANEGREIEKIETGHQFWLTGVAFSPDGRLLATSGGDKKVKIWNVENRRNSTELVGHSDWVTSLAFSPDGRSLASTSRDGTIGTWDVATGNQLQTLKGHSNWTMSVVYSKDGQNIVSNSSDGTVRIWNPSADWESREIAKMPLSIPAFGISADGRKIIAGYFDGSVSILDVLSGETDRSLEAHSNYVSSLKVSPDGRWFASASHDRSIKLWNMENCVRKMTLPSHSGPIYSIAFCPSSNQLVSTCSDEFARVWDLETGREVHRINCGRPQLMSVDYSSDGSMLAVAAGKETSIWNTSAWQLVHVLSGHSHSVQFVTFSSDGRQIATCSADQTIRLWNTSHGQQCHILKGHSGVVSCLAFSRDGDRLLSGGHDGTVRLWETGSGRELLVLRLHTDTVNCVLFSPDEKYFASSSHAGVIKLIELQHHRPAERQ